jgi:thymidylate synthase
MRTLGGTHSTLANAYQQGLRDLLQDGYRVESVRDPASIASNWGTSDRPTVEIIGYSMQIDDPYACLFFAKERPLRLEYLFGLFLWSLAGSNEVEWLTYYHPMAMAFSDDEKYLCGAFGKRLFDYKNSVNQIDAICERLLKDPSSRRTFGAICVPEDNITQSREYPCCIGVQYFLRDGVLHALTHMRAQSAFGVLPYDAFLFMALQCLLAKRLGAEPGVYRHHAGTFHLYESERELARQVADSQCVAVRVGSFDAEEAALKDIFAFEYELRRATITGDRLVVSSLASGKYNCETFWGQTKVVLLLHALRRLDMPAEAHALNAAIPPGLKALTDYDLQRAAA